MFIWNFKLIKINLQKLFRFEHFIFTTPKMIASQKPIQKYFLEVIAYPRQFEEEEEVSESRNYFKKETEDNLQSMFDFAKLRKQIYANEFNQKNLTLNQNDTQLYTQLIEYSFQKNFNLLESERRAFNDLYCNNIFSKMNELVIILSISLSLDHPSSSTLFPPIFPPFPLTYSILSFFSWNYLFMTFNYIYRRLLL